MSHEAVAALFELIDTDKQEFSRVVATLFQKVYAGKHRFLEDVNTWFMFKGFENPTEGAMEEVDMDRNDDDRFSDNEEAIVIHDPEGVQWVGPNYRGFMLKVHTFEYGGNDPLKFLVGLNIFDESVLVTIDDSFDARYIFEDCTLEKDFLKMWDKVKLKITESIVEAVSDKVVIHRVDKSTQTQHDNEGAQPCGDMESVCGNMESMQCDDFC